ncbi:MAG: 3-hydroxybutyryl-CoA dehydrogenase, partial [Chloroflexi bacterium]|nr:3-hydroxybutyryl-CoA dehydrogenase [Chloroflexota bacterium]
MDIADIKTIGVVGCGLMGSGIVETCARAGYRVIVREVNDELLKKGLGRVEGSLAKAVQRKKVTQADTDEARARIKGTLTLEDFAPCDLVVEAAIENMAEKKAVFAA